MAKQPDPKRKVVPAPRGSELKLETRDQLLQQAGMVNFQHRNVFGGDFADQGMGSNFVDPLRLEAAKRVEYASRLGRMSPFEDPYDFGSRIMAKLEAEKVRKALAEKGVYKKDINKTMRMVRDKSGARIEHVPQNTNIPFLNPALANLSIRAARMFAEQQ